MSVESPRGGRPVNNQSTTPAASIISFFSFSIDFLEKASLLGPSRMSRSQYESFALSFAVLAIMARILSADTPRDAADSMTLSVSLRILSRSSYLRLSTNSPDIVLSFVNPDNSAGSALYSFAGSALFCIMLSRSPDRLVGRPAAGTYAGGLLGRSAGNSPSGIDIGCPNRNVTPFFLPFDDEDEDDGDDDSLAGGADGCTAPALSAASKLAPLVSPLALSFASRFAPLFTPVAPPPCCKAFNRLAPSPIAPHPGPCFADDDTSLAFSSCCSRNAISKSFSIPLASTASQNAISAMSLSSEHRSFTCRTSSDS